MWKEEVYTILKISSLIQRLCWKNWCLDCSESENLCYWRFLAIHTASESYYESERVISVTKS